MGNSKIPYVSRCWEIVSGCTPISPGCAHCWAKRLAPRLGVDFSKVTLHPERLEEPLRWRKPQRVFVCSRSDLFHKDVPIDFIDQVMDVIQQCPQHTFLLLTKRPKLILDRLFGGRVTHQSQVGYGPNIWLGVSVENQEHLKRVWTLLQTPASIRFVSLEPLLGPVDLDALELLCKTWRRGATIGTYLDWVIVGGESGPHHRPMEIAWLRGIVEQCQAAGIPVWVKQDSATRPGQQGRIPDELWELKQMPEVTR